MKTFVALMLIAITSGAAANLHGQIHGRIAGDTNFLAQFNALDDDSGTMQDAERLAALFELDWEYSMHEYPEWGTSQGYTGRNHLWTDNSSEAMERRREITRAQLRVIESIDPAALGEQDVLNYDLFRSGLEQEVESWRFPGEVLQINQMGGIQQYAPYVLSTMPRASLEDYRNILARMRGLPEQIDRTIEWLERGIELGVTPPAVTLRDVPEQVKNLLADDPTESPLYAPFQNMPEDMPATVRRELQTEAVAIYRQHLAPAFWRLHEFLADTYIPAARSEIGMSALPDGGAWYGFRVRRSTTTNMTPEEIHQLGLREVARIRAQMQQIIDSVGFDGSFAEFLEFLRTDPQFFYTEAVELIQGYRDIAKRADAELVRFFGTLPRLPYGVTAVPSYAEKSQTTAYYQSGSLRAGRPGYFYANTYALSTRPKWEMEALTLHEAVPGHHLQISLAQELEDVPEFRRQGGYTAFVEGWGLYAESLGQEMGFYRDPYSKFGQLTYEMWRAIRLVVDTGIHALGWSREQAIDYFLENSSKTEHDVTVEVDRYIVWPAQALAYKIGELKILELRDLAIAELGGRFDIREFHDQLLGNGALPLDVLERQMRRWIAERSAAPSSNTPGSRIDG